MKTNLGNSAAPTAPIIVMAPGNGNGPLKLLIGSIVAVGGGLYAKKLYDEYKRNHENEKTGTDPNANIAAQIHDENRATYTSDSTVISLFKQVSDLKKVSDSYSNISGGKALLEDTRKHVSSGTYQEILNIVGVKGGGIKPSSQASQNLTKTLTKPTATYLVASADARIRKSPKKTSAVFTLHPNIIVTAPKDSVIGYVDFEAMKNNGGKQFYDSETNIFFIPVRIFDKNTLSKTYPAFVATSTIMTTGVFPKTKKLIRLDQFTYDRAYATNGVNGLLGTSALLM